MIDDIYSGLPDFVRSYLDYLLSVKGRSELTVYGYGLDLALFYRFLLRHRKLVSDTIPFDQISIQDITLDFATNVQLNDAYAFMAFCQKERDNDAAARARKAVSLKRFYRFLEINQVIEKNPFEHLESPKTKKALPKYLTLDQSIDLLDSIDGKFRERDYCIITLFLNCGLRISELVGLNLSDFSSDGTVRVTGKGNKERTVYLSVSCTAALRNYLAVRPADGLEDRDALFISRNHRRISVRAVQDIVDKFLAKAGLDGKGFSPHKLRHTAATLMYQHGNVDVLQLKEILGHADLSTTEIYTHITDEQLRASVEANPLSHLSPSTDSQN